MLRESTEIILCVSYIPEFRYTVPMTYRPSLPLSKAKKISKLKATEKYDKNVFGAMK